MLCAAFMACSSLISEALLEQMQKLTSLSALSLCLVGGFLKESCRYFCDGERRMAKCSCTFVCLLTPLKKLKRHTCWEMRKKCIIGCMLFSLNPFLASGGRSTAWLGAVRWSFCLFLPLSLKSLRYAGETSRFLWFNTQFYFRCHINFSNCLIHQCQSRDAFGVGCVCGLTRVQSECYAAFACTGTAAEAFVTLWRPKKYWQLALGFIVPIDFWFFVSSELKSRFKATIYNFFECPTVLNDRALFGNK